MAKPLTATERVQAQAVADDWGTVVEESAPISVIGTGPDLNAATDNGLARAAELLGMSVPEVKNRATITGAIEIGRHPGVVNDLHHDNIEIYHGQLFPLDFEDTIWGYAVQDIAMALQDLMLVCFDP